MVHDRRVVENLLDRIEESEDADFYEALLLHALDEIGDLQEAIRVADAAVELRKNGS